MTSGPAGWVAGLALCLMWTPGAAGEEKRQAALLIDTHDHLSGILGRSGRSDYPGAARAALEVMDRLDIRRTLIMPPPQPPGFANLYTMEDLLGAARGHAGRFSVLGGGGSLNVMIQEAVSGGTSAKLRREFEKRALAILAQGAVGFGEMTAEHLSLNPEHPYVSAPPDHPLFLLLADLAAAHGVPIDLHMEAVSEPLRLPSRFSSPPNPATLAPNIPAFERLLAHNREARIIWVHAGWDNTGHRTAALSTALLQRHPNLYMSLRIVSPPEGRPAHEPSLTENRPVDDHGKIKPEWLELLSAFPDRFLLGSDEFFLSPEIRRQRHPSTGSAEATTGLLSQLPPDLAGKVGHENARRVFGLDD